MSIVDSSGGHFGTSEDVDFPKVLNKMVRPGECAEKSVDLHKVLKTSARAAEISATIVSFYTKGARSLHINLSL